MDLSRLLSSLIGLALIRLRALSRHGSEARDLAILMDAAYYLANNPDVALGRWSPLWHYLLFGAAERRNPHPLFDTAFYLESYPDVERSGVNPLMHYILHGAREGRSPSRTWRSQQAEASLETVSSNPLVRDILRQALRPPAPDPLAKSAGDEAAPPPGVAPVPASLPTQSYHLPNLPNMFSPSRWSGEKTNILYLIPTFHVGGAEVFDLRILSCLPRDRFRVILIAGSPEGPWYEEFKNAVDEIFCLEHMADDEDGRMAFLRYLMIGKCVDLVFNRNTKYGYRLARDWPNVTRQVRYVDLLHVHAFGEDWVRDSAPYHDKLNLRYVTSEDLPEYAAKEYGLDPKGFQSLDYGFELDELPDDAARAALRREIRTQWSIPASAFVVGFVGRLTDQKDPLRWLSIAAAIEARHRDSVFLVVGDGELFNDAGAAAAKLGLAGRVIFAGYQRRAAQYTAAMDVLLMTSKYEGLPMMVLQALAHGTPVVSSDVGGIGRFLTPRTGRVVPVDASASAYAEAVLEWRDIPGSGRSIAATFRELVAARFDKRRMSERLVEDLSALALPLNLEERRKDYQLDLMKRPILW